MIRQFVPLQCWKLWFLSLLLIAGTAVAGEAGGNPWRALTPEELAMTGEPQAPGAAAVYLYTQIDRDDNTYVERVHHQVKILTEEGRNRANIEIAYDRRGESIRAIEARVIQPDGTIVPFSGTVYDRPLLAGREVTLYARNFTLQDVRVGSVIEYRYQRRWYGGPPASSRWLLHQDLFTRHARYSLRINGLFGARWSSPRGLPEGTAPPELRNDMLRLETRNVPAFVTEEYMPPADDLKFRVEFVHGILAEPASDPDRFWREFGKSTWRAVEGLIGNSRRVREALARIVSPDDSPEQKVRKIYDHVQQLRNTSYERQPEGREAQRPRPPRSAADVAGSGHGGSGDLLVYFVALVRAAGVPAAPVLVAGRSQRFSNKDDVLSVQFGTPIAAVTIDGRDLFLDPAVPILPFGLLHWSETAAPALRLDKDGGQWITTPMPQLQDAVIRRKARLALAEDGLIEGTVGVTYTGHEAVRLRLLHYDGDEQSRRDALQEELRGVLAAPAEVTLVGQPDWAGSDGVLHVEYRIRLPQWAVSSGNRLLIGVGLFGAREKGMFVTPGREHPLYFSHPYMVEDELEITLPAGYRLQNAPAASAQPDEGLGYATSVESRGDVVSIRRTLSLHALLARASQYPRFRAFYQSVRTGDGEQVVLAR